MLLSLLKGNDVLPSLRFCGSLASLWTSYVQYGRSLVAEHNLDLEGIREFARLHAAAHVRLPPGLVVDTRASNDKVAAYLSALRWNVFGVTAERGELAYGYGDGPSILDLASMDTGPVGLLMEMPRVLAVPPLPGAIAMLLLPPSARVLLPRPLRPLFDELHGAGMSDADALRWAQERIGMMSRDLFTAVEHRATFPCAPFTLRAIVK